MSTTTSGEPTGEFALHTSWHAENAGLDSMTSLLAGGR